MNAWKDYRNAAQCMRLKGFTLSTNWEYKSLMIYAKLPRLFEKHHLLHQRTQSLLSLMWYLVYYEKPGFWSRSARDKTASGALRLASLQGLESWQRNSGHRDRRWLKIGNQTRDKSVRSQNHATRVILVLILDSFHSAMDFEFPNE